MNPDASVAERSSRSRVQGRRSLAPLAPLEFGKAVLQAYEDLRRLAQHYLGGERVDHTLQATAVVHEAYLRLARRPAARWVSHVHFFNIAAREMRRVLIDHARIHGAVRRQNGTRVELEEAATEAGAELDFDFVALGEGLAALEAVDARKARIVELRYFSGLTIEETAEVLEVSAATVVREWRLARAWLFRELGRKVTGPQAPE